MTEQATGDFETAETVRIPINLIAPAALNGRDFAFNRATGWEHQANCLGIVLGLVLVVGMTLYPVFLGVA